MRGATQCARRLKQLFRSLRTKLGKVARPTPGDAITQMILGILSRDVPESKAREALDRLRGLVVDYNELRVVPPIEMAEMLGEFPDGRTKCEDLARALNAVFMREHELSLEPLRGLSRKEVVNYVEAIDGLDSYTRARIRLLGLQQHAVPLDEAMWAYARKAQIVDRRCPLEEAQAFLERRVPEGEALEFVALLEKQAWAEMGSAVRNREVARIASVPPDRTARNMLQLVAAGRSTIPPDREVRAATARAGSAAGLATTRKRGQTSRARRSPSKPKRRKTTRRLRASKPTRKVKARSAARRKAKARPKAKRPGKRKATARRATKRRTPPRAKAAKRTRRSPVRSRSR